MDSSSRPFDIVLWGATGFAGRLVVEYLDDSVSEADCNWAIAGRNRDKLESVRESLADDTEPEILIGDAFDRESLEEIASQTKVVCSTVGPYAKFGSDLVAACVDRQTDYCDLTGEVHWIRRMIDEHDEAARDASVRIVHCCGFDSIPSDLGVLAVQKRARGEFGARCDEIEMIVRGASGGLSGGTFASMANLFEEAARNDDIQRVVADPYGLNPAGSRDGPDGSWQQGVRWSERAECWTAPFLMASVNEKIVRRTNAICEWPYGRDFEYGECMSTGRGVGAALRAGGIAAGLGAFAGAMALRPTRALLESLVFPDPGEGPDREEVESGYFSVELLGRGETESSEPFEIREKIRGHRDPGYGATATMLGESARMLAEQFDNDPGTDASDPWMRRPAGGVLTPAAAFGVRGIERLDEAGIEFEDIERDDGANDNDE